MDTHQPVLMTTAKDRSPNPLRPYYVPPSVGNATASSNSPSRPPHAHTASAAGKSVANDLFPEMDLDFKGSASEAWSASRALLDALLYKYLSVLLAQPFDVAKTVLQVSLPPGVDAGLDGGRRKASARYSDQPEDERDAGSETGEESDDMPDYFSSAAPRSRSPRKRRRTPPSEGELSPTPTSRNRRNQPGEEDYNLRLKRHDSLTHVMSTLYNTSGAVGLWRGTNCTFLYSVLLKTTDSFIRSLLLALLGLPEIAGPDPSGLGSALSASQAGVGLSGLDLSDSPNAFGSLVVVGLSSALAAVLLSPLDQVRTRLIMAPTTHHPRGVVQNLRRLPSLLAPSSLWLPTALAHSIPQLFSASAPLILRRYFKISPEATPGVWSLSSFCTCLSDLFLRLPLETIERRAQVHAMKRTEPLLPTIVEPAPYAGIGGTVYSILYQEGETRTKDPRTGMVKIKRGQGFAGLVRGWRVGFWGLVGVWGAGAMGPGEGRGRGEF